MATSPPLPVSIASLAVIATSAARVVPVAVPDDGPVDGGPELPDAVAQRGVVDDVLEIEVHRVANDLSCGDVGGDHGPTPM